MRRGPVLVLILACSLAAWSVYSYWTAGFVYVLASGTPGQGPWLERVRETVAGWGRLAPLVYTLAVVVEVIVAPIPGTLLYAPAGAIFGGFVGGSLSLVGNVIGAAICCVIGQMIGGRVLARRAGGLKTWARNVALFFAAPFVGLAYVIALPFVGLGMLAWTGFKAIVDRADNG